jgi:putative Mn2+ efflux pump MntP
MKLLLMLLGIIMAQISLIIAFHTSHIIVSVLLLFLSITMIFGGLPNHE